MLSSTPSAIPVLDSWVTWVVPVLLGLLAGFFFYISSMGRFMPWTYNKLRRWWTRLSRRGPSGVFVTKLEAFASTTSASKSTIDGGNVVDMAV
eukprot:scaffold347257_cov52-Prasinocladus_malaysianus.AAC.1